MNNPLSKQLFFERYADPGATFEETMGRIAKRLGDNLIHQKKLYELLVSQAFLPAGRIQTAMGSKVRNGITAVNCFVAPNIQDSFTHDKYSIMAVATYAAETMRMGGGIGFNFSLIRPEGDSIKSSKSSSSGPVSFMSIYDAVCKTVASAGKRRGAMMAVLRVDHPDIRKFIHAKNNNDNLTAFNISVAITDKFMSAVKNDEMFPLMFNNQVYEEVKARTLWNEIMQSTYDWAEPGVIFIDKFNKYNNLWYVAEEEISAVNPCSEQSLPEHGSCLLGSLNLVKFINKGRFDFEALREAVKVAVRALDNVIDQTEYPLKEQRDRHLLNRRIGLGYTGLANALEILGHPYASESFLALHEEIAKAIRDTAYLTSVSLAKEKGPFPLFDQNKFIQGKFIQTLPYHIRETIYAYGIRNSHLLSIQPTGTISLIADNISSGLEPVFAHSTVRTVNTLYGKETFDLQDYAIKYYNVYGKTAYELSVDEHLAVLAVAQRYVDNGCSKTTNVSNLTLEEFQDVYMKAYDMGIKAVSTFNLNGKRFGIIEKKEEPIACSIDPATGIKTCE